MTMTLATFLFWPCVHRLSLSLVLSLCYGAKLQTIAINFHRLTYQHFHSIIENKSHKCTPFRTLMYAFCDKRPPIQTVVRRHTP